MPPMRSPLEDMERADAYKQAKKDSFNLEKQLKKAAKFAQDAGRQEQAKDLLAQAQEAHVAADRQGRKAVEKFDADLKKAAGRRSIPSSTNKASGNPSHLKYSRPSFEVQNFVPSDEDLNAESSDALPGSWTISTPQTSVHSMKRYATPSMSSGPNKRPHIHNPPASMQTSPEMEHSGPGSMLADYPEMRPRNASYLQQSMYAPSLSRGAGEDQSPTAHWAQQQQEQQTQGYYSNTQAHACNSGYSGHERVPTAYGNLPQSYDSPHSTSSASRNTHIDATTRMRFQGDSNMSQASASRSYPGSTLGSQPPTPQVTRALPGFPVAHFAGGLHESSALVPLQSPIWKSEAPNPVPKKQRKLPAPATPRNLQRRHGLTRVYPYDDGGIPGDGGSSSDEDLMLNPAVVGREAYIGGRRGATAVVPAAKSMGPYKPLLGLDHETYLKRSETIFRRKRKLLHRELKAKWDAANAEDNEEEMDRLENFVATRSKGPGASAKAPRRTDVDREGYLLSPQSLQTATLSMASNRIASNSNTEPAVIAQSQVFGGSTPATSDTGFGDDLSGTQDATPFDRAFYNGNQSTKLGGSDYQASEALPKGSINFYNRHTYNRAKQNSIESWRASDGVGIAHGSRVRSSTGTTADQHMESPQVIVISSGENTPVFKRSQPMKERLEPPKKRATREPNRSRLERSNNIVEKNVDPEFARQQRCADATVLRELQVASGELQEEFFGDAIDLTPEQQAQRAAEINRRSVERREQAKLQADMAKEKARQAENQKQKEIAEVREKERLAKEREELSRKAKRETERKRQLAEEEERKETKRKLAAARIAADRERRSAEEAAREEAKKKAITIEIDTLKLKLLRADLANRKHEAASLTNGKARNLVGSKDPTANEIPSATEDNPLFVSDIQDINGEECTNLRSATRDVTELFASQGQFRAKFAEERDQVTEQRRLETKKRIDASKARYEAQLRAKEDAKEALERPRPKPQKRSRAASKAKVRAQTEDPESTLAGVLTPLLADKPGNPRAAMGKRAPKHPQSAPTVIGGHQPKIYLSETRLLTPAELANTSKTQAEDPAAKLRLLLEKRAKTLPGVEAKYKMRLMDEAKRGNFEYKEEEIKARVKAHMETLERAYMRKQAKKGYVIDALQGASQAQEQQGSTSFENGEVDPEQPQAHSSDDLAGGRHHRGGNYTQKTVSDLAGSLTQSDLDKILSDSDDSDQSEEDPDDDDDDMMKHFSAKQRGSQHTGSGGEQGTGGSMMSGGAGQQDGSIGADGSQRQTSNPSGPSNSKVTDSGAQGSKEASAQIRIYTVTKSEIKAGDELPDTTRQLHDRDEANEMAKDFMQEYRQQATEDEESFSKQLVDGLYYGKSERENANSLVVKVTSAFADPVAYGLQSTKLHNIYSERMWVIKQTLTKTIVDEAGNKTREITKDEINGLVYTDRSYANTHACEYLIEFLKPPKEYEATELSQWANENAPAIRKVLENFEAANGCFECGLHLNDTVWQEYDEIDISVEVRQTKGPRN